MKGCELLIRDLYKTPLFVPFLGYAHKNNPRNITHMPACPGTPTGRLFFSHDLILNKNEHFSKVSIIGMLYSTILFSVQKQLDVIPIMMREARLETKGELILA